MAIWLFNTLDLLRFGLFISFEDLEASVKNGS